MRWLLALIASLVLAPSTLRAEPDKRCLAEYESGQRSRRDGDLLAARRSFVICAQATCPEIVSTDCAQWIREVEEQIPTVTAAARWSDGEDVTTARVLIDGALVAKELDGKPIAVNPGRHRIVIEAEGKRVERTFVASAGERSRVIRLTLEREAARTEPPEGPSAMDVVPWVLAGLSVAALIGFTVLAVKGTNDLEELRETCAPNCAPGSLDPIKRDFLVADILLGVGIAAAIGSVTLFVIGASVSDKSASLSFRARY